jgi:SAM-dependent methyltransferase
MSDRYQDINAAAIDRWAEQGWEWARPVGHGALRQARSGDWEVYLTPTKPMPRAWLGELAGRRVLGLASAGGQQGPIFAAAGAKVTILDYAPVMLEQDRLVAEREGLDIRLVHADMTRPLPFDDESFDIVFNPVSICYIREVEPIWREVARVLAPGGVFVTGFDTIVNFLVDEAEERIVWRHPFDPITDPEVRAFLADEEGGLGSMQFGHDLTETVGSLLRVGQHIDDLYEDANGEGRLHEMSIPTYLAIRAHKPYAPCPL